MLFNSIDFAIFLPLVFSIYWLIGSSQRKLQNVFIVISSYVFYGWWDPRFLILIFASSMLDFSIGIKIEQANNQKIRKALLWLSILFNVGCLGFFKYCNFFIENFLDAFQALGVNFQASTLNIILPVGISFYTFQTLSYTIDVYRREIPPSRDIFSFLAYVSFFPQLVAGPIEKARDLLSQFSVDRYFSLRTASDGLRQILWGLFKKVVIADNCATYANMAFADGDQSGSTLLLGAVLFAFQIYGDFSGYSDIAIGTARLFGFRLSQNFAFPYFSRDIAEFWRRWHISLSSWFKEYVYLPLGGSRGTIIQQIRNVFIIFIISGFWHGANWTFIIWGGLNAMYFLPLLYFNRNRKHIEIVAKDSALPTWKEIRGITITFTLTVFAWIFFRATSVSHAIAILSEIFSPTLFQPIAESMNLRFLPLLIAIFFMIEWLGRADRFAIERIWLDYPRFIRWGLYYCIMFAVIFLNGGKQEFIYFQF